MNLRVLLHLDEDDGGFVVSCPALTGCHSQGETEAEAIENISDAIEGWLAVMNARVTTDNPGDRVVEVSVA